MRQPHERLCLENRLAGFPDTASLPCYVLEDGRRVLSSRGLQSATGMSSSSTGGEEAGSRLDRMLGTKWFKSLLNKDLESGLSAPIKFSWQGKIIYGFPAETLTGICKVLEFWLPISN